MTDFDDCYGLIHIVDFVDHPVIAVPEPEKSVFTFKHLNARRPWIDQKLLDFSKYFQQVHGGNSAKFFFSASLEEKFKGGHPFSNSEGRPHKMQRVQRHGL